MKGKIDMLKLVVKCWTTKNGKLCKGLFYETKNGRFLLTFDKFAIIALIGSQAYKTMSDGCELTSTVYVDEEESEVFPI